MTTTQTAPGGNLTPTPGATDHGSQQQPTGSVAYDRNARNCGILASTEYTNDPRDVGASEGLARKD